MVFLASYMWLIFIIFQKKIPKIHPSIFLYCFTGTLGPTFFMINEL